MSKHLRTQWKQSKISYWTYPYCTYPYIGSWGKGYHTPVIWHRNPIQLVNNYSKIYGQNIVTSCSSTDSERLHHCNHPVNNPGSCWIFPILHNGLEMSPELPIHLEESGPPHKTRFLGSIWVHISNITSVSSAVFVWITAVTNTHTNRPRNTGNNRPYPMLFL